MYIISNDTFYQHKYILDGYVFWKQINDKIHIKPAMPGIIPFLNTL